MLRMKNIVLSAFGLLLCFATPSLAGWTWVPITPTDCTDSDRKFVTGAQPPPEPAECNENTAGTAAICHAFQPNLPNSPYCTYKALSAANCHGGGFPGPTWVCQQQ
jgi:hypothetical protein